MRLEAIKARVRERRGVVVAALVMLVVLALVIGRALLVLVDQVERDHAAARWRDKVRIAASSIQPSVGLYWTSTTDPTIAPGVHAPLWQPLWRTDVPSVYVKTAAADTGWTLLGAGGALTSLTVDSPLAGAGTPASHLACPTCVTQLAPATNGPGNLCANGSYHLCIVDNFCGGLFTADPLTCNSVTGATTSAFLASASNTCLVQGQTGLNAGQVGGWALGFGGTCNGTGANLAITPGSRTFHAWADISIDAAGSAGNNVLFRFGFNQAYASTANGTDAIQAVYDSSASSNWQLETRAASVSTFTATSCTVDFSATTFELLEVRLTSTGHAQLYKNNVLCADTTTTIPTAAMTLGSTWQKVNTGATNMHPTWDWAAFAVE
jgi:hypothetical protein